MKIKPLTKEQITISTDRLTRFKNTETKYLRVFSEIILHNLIEPKYSRADLEAMDYELIKNLAQDVINYSLEELGLCCENDLIINKKLSDYENSVYKNNEQTKNLLDNNINYCAILKLLNADIPKNLQWLKALLSDENTDNLRKKYSFRFPIEVLVLTEGATEETLLPEFAKLCDFDFDKEGIYIIAAGGKNQVVKLYYELSDCLNIPIFVLFDKDGRENAQEISPKLRMQDLIHILECGEFEDVLTEGLFKRALNYELQNISIPATEIDTDLPRVKILEDIFKKRGMHELKKVEFAKTVKENIKSAEDVSPEMHNIIEEIKSLKP